MIVAVFLVLAGIAVLGWISVAHFGLRRMPPIAPAVVAETKAPLDTAEPHRDQSVMAGDDSLFGHAPVGLCQLALDGRIVRTNHKLGALCGFSEEQLSARFLPNLLHSDDIGAIDVVLTELAAGYGDVRELQSRLLHSHGHTVWVRLAIRLVRGRGRPIHFLVAVTDISSEMAVRDELHELNSRLREINLRLRESVRLDGLTRCLNRVALFDEAEKALMLARRYKRSSTLVFFDLNNFKDINDSFGHHVGDRALIAFAEQIKARLRTTDELGRYGGDEFVALLRETDAEQALQLVSTLAPIVIDNEGVSSIILRFSAGVACSDDEGIESVDDWLRIADGLMYRQKVGVLRGSGGRAY